MHSDGRNWYIFSANKIFNDGVHFFLPSNASNDSDDESTFNDQSYLMDEVRIVEGALCELTHEHHLEDKVFFCFWSVNAAHDADWYIFHNIIY